VLRERPESATATASATVVAADEARSYLLVVDSGSSSRFHLPHSGLVLIGRAAEAELRLEHPSVSRRHARIVVDAGEARITDLDSHNGTRVNGVALDGARLLATGDVVAVGEVVLVVHAAPRALGRTVLGEAELRRRLDEEVERALGYGRPLALAVLAGSADPAAAARALRTIDLLATADESLLLVLMPEMAAGPARAAAERIVAAVGGEARAGVAACPDDACDAADLLIGARAAAAAAAPGAVASVAEASERLELGGGRSVLLAHPAMLRVYELVRRLAAADLPVLITGETGVGKEHAAFAVHHLSPRARGPYVALSCAAMPETLVESELFGHERGAFTGAAAAKAGVLETASGGTLFLDEVGELAPAAQAKLLRALESHRITRLGDVRERPVDVRLVAATNRNLAEDVKAGRFRQDLYFRLGAATVILPPLRERRCEIPLLARAFLDGARARAGRTPLEMAAGAMHAVLVHAWPGNVRELKNLMELFAATIDDTVTVEDVRAALGGEPPDEAPDAPVGAPPALGNLAEELRALERRRILQALEAAGGVRTRAAALIGMPIRTFTWKLKQHGLGTKA
jgi:DNA-binding NtrC family response regulator